ncbi:OPT oligopeptide transporter protein-domain-containing protein [Fusarium sp. MPI-SDFR-AT-0072]|nr:OPT oligopeptide transporter protein-domain-containing protein [Fusarium sp. MPI-SDFR-AT-0072]
MSISEKETKPESPSSKADIYPADEKRGLPQDDKNVHDIEIMSSDKVKQPLETAEDIVTHVIQVDDDPTMNPWTIRMFVVGIGLSAFGGVLQEIMYFKPQVVYVSVMFLTVLAETLGTGLAHIIPRRGRIGRLLNPGPWNRKEHTAAVLMASAASVSALSTEALTVQKLWYGGYPDQAAGIFITLSSQLIGYGVAGMMRSVLLYPTKMLYPANLPITTVMETLHKPKSETRKRFQVFWIVFVAIFCWEWFPEYIFPLLSAVSIFCLADRHNPVFTNLFGGSQGNEGMGFLSICFDWNYIAGFGSPLWMPLQTLFNSYLGYIGGIALSMGLYYGNYWRAKDFPFMAQLLYDGSSNTTSHIPYNETAIMNPDFTVNNDLVDQQGLPYLTATYINYLITSNAGLTATIVHMLLWNYAEVSLGWSWITIANMKKLLRPETYKFWQHVGSRTEEEKQKLRDDPTIDPHYKLMLDYDEVPNSWYFVILLSSIIIGLACLYAMKSTLPWWGFILAIIFLVVFLVFFGAQYAITGFGFNLQPIFQMLAGYMFPGRPLANMYFTSYTYNALSQGFLLLRDLKLAQQNKLSPKATFTTQVIGCILGALLNYVMMISIVDNQAAILKSAEGTNVWSGAQVQQFNTLAIAWSIAPKMFSIGARYEWVTIAYLIGFAAPLPFYFAHKFFPHIRIFSYLNTPIILWYLGYLFVGLNASVTSYFILGAFGQFYLRRYRPEWFVKWNYLISAALDGGTQVMVFIATFAVFGGSGKSVPFPAWAGNKVDNFDYCAFNANMLHSLEVDPPFFQHQKLASFNISNTANSQMKITHWMAKRNTEDEQADHLTAEVGDNNSVKGTANLDENSALPHCSDSDEDGESAGPKSTGASSEEEKSSPQSTKTTGSHFEFDFSSMFNPEAGERESGGYLNRASSPPAPRPNVKEAAGPKWYPGNVGDEAVPSTALTSLPGPRKVTEPNHPKHQEKAKTIEKGRHKVIGIASDESSGSSSNEVDDPWDNTDSQEVEGQMTDDKMHLPKAQGKKADKEVNFVVSKKVLVKTNEPEEGLGEDEDGVLKVGGGFSQHLDSKSAVFLLFQSAGLVPERYPTIFNIDVKHSSSTNFFQAKVFSDWGALKGINTEADLLRAASARYTHDVLIMAPDLILCLIAAIDLRPEAYWEANGRGIAVTGDFHVFNHLQLTIELGETNAWGKGSRGQLLMLGRRGDQEPVPPGLPAPKSTNSQTKKRKKLPETAKSDDFDLNWELLEAPILPEVEVPDETCQRILQVETDTARRSIRAIKTAALSLPKAQRGTATLIKQHTGRLFACRDHEMANHSLMLESVAKMRGAFFVTIAEMDDAFVVNKTRHQSRVDLGRTTKAKGLEASGDYMEKVLKTADKDGSAEQLIPFLKTHWRMRDGEIANWKDMTNSVCHTAKEAGHPINTTDQDIWNNNDWDSFLRLDRHGGGKALVALLNLERCNPDPTF